jgi:hypothetical protein
MNEQAYQASMNHGRATLGRLRYFPSASGKASMHHRTVWNALLDCALQDFPQLARNAYQISKLGTGLGVRLRAEIPAIVLDEFWQAEQANIKARDARLWSVFNIAVNGKEI